MLFRPVRILSLVTLCLCANLVAHAAPRSCSNKPDRTPYFEFLSKSCPAGGCAVEFPAVPQGCRLEITHVSVLFSGTTFNRNAWVLLGGTYPTPDTAKAFLPTPTSLGEDLPGYIVSTPITAFIEPASQPNLFVNVNFSNGYIQASVSGYLVAAD